MKRSAALLAVLAVLAACGDQRSATEPAPPPALHAAKAPAGTTTSLAPLDDAIDRVGPALGASADAEQARTLLSSVRDQVRAGKAAQLANSTLLRNLDASLDRLVAATPALGADADVVRFAVGPLR